jgi:hypothetical protein
MKRTKWLICSASPGQFSDEVAVRGEDYQGNDFSLFTSRKFVHCDRTPTVDFEVSALLQAVVLDQRDSLYLIRLPGQTFDNGSTITVRAEQLEDQPSRQYA